VDHFKVKTELCWNNKCVTKNLLVDTGSTLPMISRDTAEKLKLPILIKGYEFDMMTGKLKVDIAAAEVKIEDRRFAMLVGIIDNLKEEVIGVRALELLGYAIDPINKKLIKTEFFPPRI